MTQAGQYLREIKHRLTSISDTPGLDAQVLLAHLLGVDRAWILAHPEADLTEAQAQQIQADLRLLESGKPLPYILGQWEFYGRKFRVTPDVLIPRPETELLVERAIQHLTARPGRPLIADVGTGSGCIAISLACAIPTVQVLAVDISWPALKVAQVNAHFHQVEEQVLFIQSDLLTGTGRPLDMICANLPYIPTTALRQLSVYGKEPELALDGGPDGLRQIRRLLQAAPRHLAQTGMLLLEIESGQGPAVMALSRGAFPQAKIELFSDLAGRDRLVEIVQPNRPTFSAG